ncbi:MAG: YqaJ viral recombinase family protein [Proteobacteria bacterium]|nr:YqaJ viral recombinase family protein [Pseudomonadota bacterium]
MNQPTFYKEEDFLKVRKQGIGASDVANICGVGYGSPLQVFLEKTGRTTVQDNAAMRRAQGADMNPAPGQAAQPREDFLVAVEMNLEARADEQGGHMLRLIDPRLRGQANPVARRHGRAVLGNQMPAIESVAAHAVGHAQGLDGRGEGDHREIRHQQESDGLGAGWNIHGLHGWASC